MLSHEVDRAAAALVRTVARPFEVQAPPAFVFEAMTTLERWPALFPSCRAVEVVSREGWRATFVFTAADGQRWTSAHYACPDGLFSFTERQGAEVPSFQCVRTFRPGAAGTTHVTETVTCVWPADRATEADTGLAAIEQHAAQVQPVLRERLEAAYARHQCA